MGAVDAEDAEPVGVVAESGIVTPRGAPESDDNVVVHFKVA